MWAFLCTAGWARLEELAKLRSWKILCPICKDFHKPSSEFHTILVHSLAHESCSKMLCGWILIKTWTWKMPSLQIKLYGRVFLNRQPGNHITSRLLLVEKSDRFKVTVHWPSVSFFIQVSTRWLVILSKLLLIPTYYSNIPAIFMGKFNVELIESSVNKRHKILWQSHGWLFL